MFAWPRRKARKGYLAIQTGGGFVSHVEVNWQNDRPRLAACHTQPSEGDDARAWSGFARAPVPVGVVLSAGEYQLLPLDAPQVPPAELKMAVRWKIKDQLDFPIDDATVDVIRLETGGSDEAVKLLAIAANNQVLKKYVTLAERAKLSLASIDIPELAQRNLSALLETPDTALALLSFTPQGGLLTVTRNGELAFFRRIEFNAREMTAEDDYYRTSSLDRVALELQRSFDHIERQHGDWHLEKILLAPAPGVPGLVEYLQQQLYLPVELTDMSTFFTGELPAAPETWAHCWFSLGGALRREEVGP